MSQSWHVRSSSSSPVILDSGDTCPLWGHPGLHPLHSRSSLVTQLRREDGETAPPGAGRLMPRPHAASAPCQWAPEIPVPTPALHYSASPCSAFHMDVGDLNLGPHFCGAANSAPTVPSPSCSLQFWARAGAVASGQRFTHGGWRRQLRSQASLSSTWAQRWNLVYQLGDKLCY